ncbi:EI24 domain-containing protein [Mycetocola miduiensis]|uniref:CysZ protein n=1 Tax=Mycetocola miduiensis TaxID=995034 RepID=A0A1I5B546_9MICO|nr:EI24 domain-containing protein [Mycetocola miduiensis]SFN69824.1 CysZ protein [Mycetocola miduiensis]
MTTETAKPGFFSGFGMGIRLLGRGFRLWVTSPRLMVIGAIPGLITLALFTVAVVLLALNLENVATILTPFANGWDETFRSGLRVLVAVALIAAEVLILVYLFAAVTLMIGQPFFERIAERVENSLGGVPSAVDVPFWPSVVRGIGESLRVVAITIGVGLGLLLLGFIPVLGPICAAVIGAVTGGWFLALELSTVTFERRGLRLDDRRRLLKAQRSTTLGFGVAVFLLFLVPLGAVVTMPAAVAGATLLARRSLGESDRLPSLTVQQRPQS